VAKKRSAAEQPRQTGPAAKRLRRNVIDPLKTTRWRRENNFFSITVALIVTGRSTSLETWTFLGDFLGPTVDDEIQAWNLTPHSGVWFFTNLPSGIRKSAPRRLGLDFLDSSSSLTLFGPSTSPHPFLAVQLLAVSAPFTVSHRSDLPDQRPKTKTSCARLSKH
jgi:hypothetical protein